ncbi:reverse transcriptase [Gossypium australe]|uniref:Reverse transcriptase n=1 Tax=Gossypium australe TaxID=47621 RepID=A0A5B6UUQ3_9ROSI|nr:reverse transcriptase [Gossypium australe]
MEKKIILTYGDQVYVKFKYKKFSLFCFACGRLGHGDSFCPTRLHNGGLDVVLRWDLTLRAPVRKATIATSVWLWEDNVGNNYGNIAYERNIRSNWRNVKQEGMSCDQWGVGVIRRNQGMEDDMEKNPIKDLEGKKCPRVCKSNLMVSGELNSSDFHDERLSESQTSKTATAFGFTGFYGTPNVRYKEDTWNLLKTLGRGNNLPWMVNGDFNEILYSLEKNGGIPRESG